VTSTLALIAETIEPDVDRLERIDGLPALRVLHQGAESVVLVLPATGGMKRLLELHYELAALRARTVTITIDPKNPTEALQRLREALTQEHDPDAA